MASRDRETFDPGEVILAALDDPWYARYQASQWREPPHFANLVSYSLLRDLSRKHIIAVILQTRIAQIAEFARIPRDPRETGFKVVRRDGKSPTRADEKEAERIQGWLLTCGEWSWADKHKEHRVYRQRLSFEYLCRALMRDSLRYDQACAQIVHTRLGKPLCVLPVDAATIRINEDASGYVQVLEEYEIVAEFAPEEMLFGIRRPRTDLQSMGYGYPELIEVVDILTAFLWGYQYNANYFRQGMNTKGILVVPGGMLPEQLQAFRRELQAVATGVGSAHRIPILNPKTEKSNIQWLSLGRANSDMEYREWMNWLMKVLCGIYLIDPAEIGFQFGAEGQRGAVFQSSPETRVQIGRDKGLRPLLRDLESWLNHYIVNQLNPDFVIRFQGLADFAERDRADFDDKRVRAYMTVDEIRAEHGLQPLPSGLGKLPANPSLLQIIQLGVGMGFIDAASLFGGGQPQGLGGLGGLGGLAGGLEHGAGAPLRTAAGPGRITEEAEEGGHA